ncbi:kinase-like domain-containing protein [Cantharellus anzutake]|uniref:kinase-like domain-containing protein n=1 Tax=Cantharellus anzutake TaxID=1750568 RepID=UPI0019033C3C|nr:kinase-like domain-containing protein [Cantharellus anzutake]KAF8339166.1 kinase-like domain-containing protein [Cantharellus anzutake]
MFYGLHYLHDEEIVHGNIKPVRSYGTSHGLICSPTNFSQTNILVDFDGTAVLCDYGLQTLLHDIRIPFQSIRYIAPELRQNDNGVFQCSYEGDIWAFGCVSIKIMRGERPYRTIQDETEILGTEAQAYTTDILQYIKSSEILGCLNTSPEKRSTLEEIREWVEFGSHGHSESMH